MTLLAPDLNVSPVHCCCSQMGKRQHEQARLPPGGELNPSNCPFNRREPIYESALHGKLICHGGTTVRAMSLTKTAEEAVVGDELAV